MKKSKSVPVVLVASVAAVILSGCGRNAQQVRRCVDEKGNLLPDYQCNTTSTYRGGGAGFFYPRWVYGGTTSGKRVTGYSTTPSSNADIVDSRGTVVRRGFSGSSSSTSRSVSS